MLLLNLSLVLAGSFFAWILAIPLEKWMEFQVKCSYCFVWLVGSSSEQSENCLPGVLASSLFTCSTLQTRPSFQPTPKSPSLHLQWVLTHAEYGQEEIEQNRLTSPQTFPLKVHCSYPQALGPKYVSWGRLTSLECVLFWCLARSEAFEKALLQPSCSQTYGFSPVWDLKCVFKFSSLE